MFESLTENQRLAIQLLNVPLAVKASAGSGKTSTLVERYIHLLKEGFKPRNILCVTFTNEAADQLITRILERVITLQLDESLLKEVENTRNIGTLHSLCYTIVNQYGDELGLPPVTEIVDEFMFFDSFNRYYREWLEQLSSEAIGELLEYFNHRELKEIVLEIYRQHYLFYDSLNLSTEARARDSGANVIALLGNLVKPLMSNLKAHFHQKGAYSFNDLEQLTLDIVKNSTLARTRLSGDFRQILLDEFQDTSAIQWQIIRLLLGDNFTKLFFVGDPKQSIYGFRGADPSLFEEVSQVVNARTGKTLELSYNFRTDASLLSSLNQLGSKLFQDHIFSWSDMLPGKSSLDKSGATPFRLCFFGAGEKPSRKQLQEQEPASVCPAIQKLISEGISPSSIALLFRNSDRIKSFSQYFSSHGLPTQCKSSLSLSKQLEAVEIISFLRFVAQPTNDGALVSFLRSQYSGWSYHQVLELTKKRLKTGERFEALVFCLQRENHKEFPWLFKLLETGETSVASCLERLFLETSRFPNHKNVIDALLQPLSRPGLSVFDAESFLSSFFEGDFLIQEEHNSEPNRQAIHLMTVHASKGLEFEHVFLVDTARQLPSDSPLLLLKPGLPPGIRFLQKNKKVTSSSYQALLEERRMRDAEEARRILYVAMTRAKKTLTCFIPDPDLIAYPKNSWADLLVSELKGRELERLQTSPPASFEVGTTF
jgi:ATP-dependent exoDNAse (exonuclease V) beta subunit